MGLEDGEALEVLRSVLDGAGADDFIRRFHAVWFALDPPARDLFPPDLSRQRSVFAEALRWVLGEVAARRSREPVAFLAQLGRDHRKYGVRPEHYDSLRRALLYTLRERLAGSWDGRTEDAATAVLTLMTGVMSGAADADTGPPWCTGTVLEQHRVSRDIAVVRLRLDQPLPYLPGQYVSVEVPQCPRRWRYLSPAMPSDPDGFIEFHVRAAPRGLVSPAVVAETRPGDRWRISSPHGALHVDRAGGDVLMVADGTGLAPLRALIMDLSRFGENPRVHLFFGGRYPCELYDLPTLWQIAGSSPWLSVSPVSEHPTDPPWAADYPDVTPPRGLHVRQTGLLAEVVTQYGGWGDRQILIAGRGAVVRAVRAALIGTGAPPECIQHDPLAG